jgi:hypothetical protein
MVPKCVVLLLGVSRIIQIIAYMWGNVAMAVGDSSPLSIWNYQTMRAIIDPLAQPQYTIALAAFAMCLGALSLYGTPFISLYLLSGQSLRISSNRRLELDGSNGRHWH